MNMLGWPLFAPFMALSAWLIGRLIRRATTQSDNELLTAPVCMIIVVGEGSLGYALFSGVSSGPSYWTGEGYLQKTYRMPAAGVGAMFIEASSPTSTPLLTMSVNSGEEEFP